MHKPLVTAVAQANLVEAALDIGFVSEKMAMNCFSVIEYCAPDLEDCQIILAVNIQSIGVEVRNAC